MLAVRYTAQAPAPGRWTTEPAPCSKPRGANTALKYTIASSEGSYIAFWQALRGFVPIQCLCFSFKKHHWCFSKTGTREVCGVFSEIELPLEK